MANEQTAGYGKRPLWQWILLYVVIAAVVYGAFYYFVLAKNGTYMAPAGGASAGATVQTNGAVPAY